MDTQTTVSYGYEAMLRGETMAAAREKVAAALKAEGFGVLTEIDVKETLKKKIDVDFRPYVILGACNPNLAHKALTADPQIGLLLPCNVVLQQAEGGIKVSALKPAIMFQVVDDPALKPVAEDADARIRRAMASLK
ncbi:MAG TPA: DUF302 domain-containing protein [Fimbriimonadaceae bacterium]|nr:DUF302 domain-containing protein [Fimbriimonadaceae bacterium]